MSSREEGPARWGPGLDREIRRGRDIASSILDLTKGVSHGAPEPQREDEHQATDFTDDHRKESEPICAICGHFRMRNR
ncbi:MAG: hypothetical protein D6723_16520 [Acidobacteria bacterium]|nr:MAG: hypothetical protein D6723_16520 [Acidobacteriota bacterium]